MSRKQDDDDDDEDDFWAIAMADDNNGRDHGWEAEEEDEEDIGPMAGKVIAYRIPAGNTSAASTNVTPTILKLSSLPPTDGVWSPVGADAWYASALLASLLLHLDPLQSVDQDNGSTVFIPHPIQTILASDDSSMSSGGKVVVELGSGAVGLSGFVCAVALERQLAADMERKSTATATTTMDSDAVSKWKVLLSDNDPRVLKKLQSNLDLNRDKFAVTEKKTVVNVGVSAWDWKDENPATGLLPEDQVVLVIGSELVYTAETAETCVDLLLRLLEQYVNLEIWIVQVSDRYGWWDIVVPTLQREHVRVDCISITSDIHEMATAMIPMGGTLDRYAYAAFRICKKELRVS